MRPQKSLSQLVAGFMQNDLAPILKRYGHSFESNPIPHETFGLAMSLLHEGHIDRKTARAMLDACLSKDKEFADSVKWMGQCMAAGELLEYAP